MKILITAGTVYGRLDDNKLVGNRIRGIWATMFGQFLLNHGHEVTLLVPDTFDTSKISEHISDPSGDNFKLLKHNGYDSYAEQCYALAPKVDAAVMAAAVVNWIPQTPFKGKMPTDGYREGDVQHIPFILAPRVIDRMRKLNPKIHLVGCKMTSGAKAQETLEAGYHTLVRSSSNVVVLNDLSNLKTKCLLYGDGHTDEFFAEPADGDQSFNRMFEDLRRIMEDQYYRTVDVDRGTYKDANSGDLTRAEKTFERLCEKYREHFLKRPDGGAGQRVFGAIAVRVDATRMLVSPREKDRAFGLAQSVMVTKVDHEAREVHTLWYRKASLNTPLLARMLAQRPDAEAIVHLHEQRPGLENLPYAPPGTVRDNAREFPAKDFNVINHGCFIYES